MVAPVRSGLPGLPNHIFQPSGHAGGMLPKSYLYRQQPNFLKLRGVQRSGGHAFKKFVRLVRSSVRGRAGSWRFRPSVRGRAGSSGFRPSVRPGWAGSSVNLPLARGGARGGGGESSGHPALLKFISDSMSSGAVFRFPVRLARPAPMGMRSGRCATAPAGAPTGKRPTNYGSCGWLAF